MPKQPNFFSNNDPNENYSVISDTFSKLVDRHIPLKKKTQRGNHAPFISKEIRELILPKADQEISFLKNPLRKMKENIKGNGSYVFLLDVRQLNNTFLMLSVKE